ncbi:glutaredoxin-like YruB-family protein [Acetoanaerobium pronyense]|uniref:Glutaredoxin-like YruB-family protein n=1 Tax=Acetoanaerobium pronyense TaxID=1482736 RepID=A0ABS4KID3_9FIRM|nr:glutaredoxin domain-containing protein [Acetoanaerobium pronyense]MBP2027515.1 glutaredoxin-like YruB-family protein [Acetoanaerobium pronyense]
MKTVVVYTSSTCPHCHTAKDYLKGKGVEYSEKNVSEDPEARKELIQKKIMGVPAIFIDEEVVVGFDKERIDQLLGL